MGTSLSMKDPQRLKAEGDQSNITLKPISYDRIPPGLPSEWYGRGGSLFSGSGPPQCGSCHLVPDSEDRQPIGDISFPPPSVRPSRSDPVICVSIFLGCDLLSDAQARRPKEAMNPGDPSDAGPCRTTLRSERTIRSMAFICRS